MNFKTILFAAAIGAVSTTSASAQCTDCGPGNPVSITSSVVTIGIGSLGGSFSAAVGDVSIASPAGGSVTVSAAVAQAIGALLNGEATAEQQQTATTAFGGGQTGAALTAALLAVGQGATVANVTSAVGAYNAAINALPSVNNVTPGLVAARAAIAQLIQ